MTSIKKQRGFTLTELMVSTALGIFLTAGVIEIYAGSKKTYRTQEALARLQENARFAIDTISRDLRNSGSIGCSLIANTVVQGETAEGLNYNANMATWGLQSTGGTNSSNFAGGHSVDAITTLVGANRYGHTDVLVVQGTNGCSTSLSGDMVDAASIVPITANTCGFGRNDHVLVSNCGTADIFQINSDPATSQLGHLNPLSHIYINDGFTEVFSFFSNTYFIGSEIQPDGSEIPSLFVVDNTAEDPIPLALVEGVENIQFQYGLDTDAIPADTATPDGIANRYVNAVDVGDAWYAVVSVRMTLLMRTIEELGAQAPGELNLGGETIEISNDGPIRQQVVSTIQLRNRG